MTLHKIKETVYNKFGWRLSDREERVIKKALSMKRMKLSEREEYLIKLANEVEE